MTVVRDGLSSTGNAAEFADERGWGHFLTAASARRTAKSKGPQPGDRRLVKLGRWSYEGEIESVSGGVMTVTGAKKSGEPFRVEVGV